MDARIDVPRARKPPSVSSANVPGIARPRRPRRGRGLPPVLAPKANVPALPELSFHGPLQRGKRDARVDLYAARRPGTVTTFSPRPMVPSGFGVASPTSGARCGAPHWSS